MNIRTKKEILERLKISVNKFTIQKSKCIEFVENYNGYKPLYVTNYILFLKSFELVYIKGGGIGIEVNEIELFKKFQNFISYDGHVLFYSFIQTEEIEKLKKQIIREGELLCRIIRFSEIYYAYSISMAGYLDLILDLYSN